VRLPREKKVAVLIPYRKGDKWGFCDRARKMVVPAIYDDVGPFSEGISPVKLDGKWGYIDTTRNSLYHRLPT